MSEVNQHKCGTVTEFEFAGVDILWAVFSLAVKKHVNGPDGSLASPTETEGEYRKRADKAGLLAVVKALKDVGIIP